MHEYIVKVHKLLLDRTNCPLTGPHFEPWASKSGKVVLSVPGHF